jgi:hypothetical protein
VLHAGLQKGHDQEDSIIPLVLTQYSGSNDSRFDLSRDNAFTAQDLSFWIHEVKGTWIGDANLNSSLGSEDRVTVFQAGQYEDLVVRNST